MLAGLRSRWTMPCSCAASSASAICRAIGSGLVERDRALRRCGPRASAPRPAPSRARVEPSASLEAVDRRDVRMVERREHFRFALKASQPLRVAGDRVRQDLDRDLRASASCRWRGRPRPCRRHRAARRSRTGPSRAPGRRLTRATSRPARPGAHVIPEVGPARQRPRAMCRRQRHPPTPCAPRGEKGSDCGGSAHVASRQIAAPDQQRRPTTGSNEPCPPGLLADSIQRGRGTSSRSR